MQTGDSKLGCDKQHPLVSAGLWPQRQQRCKKLLQGFFPPVPMLVGVMAVRTAPSSGRKVEGSPASLPRSAVIPSSAHGYLTQSRFATSSAKTLPITEELFHSSAAPEMQFDAAAQYTYDKQSGS